MALLRVISMPHPVSYIINYFTVYTIIVGKDLVSTHNCGRCDSFDGSDSKGSDIMGILREDGESEGDVMRTTTI
jgi:hypothetical protein